MGWLGAAAVGSIPALVTFFSFSSLLLLELLRTFAPPKHLKIGSKCILQHLTLKMFWGSMPPDSLHTSGFAFVSGLRPLKTARLEWNSLTKVDQLRPWYTPIKHGTVSRVSRSLEGERVRSQLSRQATRLLSHWRARGQGCECISGKRLAQRSTPTYLPRTCISVCIRLVQGGCD